MQSVQKNAEAFVRGHKIRNPQPTRDSREYPEPARGGREGKCHCDEKPERYIEDGKAAEEEHAGFVAVTDGPADKVWM